MSLKSIIVFALLAVAFLPAMSCLLAQAAPKGEAEVQAKGGAVTIPKVTGKFTLYPSKRPQGFEKRAKWRESGKVLEAGWQGEVGKEQVLAFVGNHDTQNSDLAVCRGSS